ncbi:Outer membrane protein TolC [Prosthecobacter debontii]|uniref:Outer membrane protein TolC n=1 Tax=Prosthecobacter debontii TaxID=48467 RepID=A0A1T4YSZ7_9BACT|nr:TolC family protein [Prosthecobacter debontii]SKB04919.1 Outer membrane protein TolC [Prosthecobacter debontii]
MKKSLFLLSILIGAGSVLAAPMHVSLPTVMKLAGANNDEIELARVRHQEAIAESKQAWQRFWPTLTLAAGYRGHEGKVQDIAGAVFDARKQQYTVGSTVMIDWSPGDIYYGALATEQKALAAEQLAEKARRDIVQQAVTRYLDLLAAEADMAIVADDLRLTEDYAGQLDGAVNAGTAFRADLLRVKTQVSRAKITMRQAQEKRDLAAAALAESLRLDPATELRPAKADLVPVSLTSVSGMATLISQAHQNRPELRAMTAAQSAAGLESDRSRVAPMIPSVQAGYSVGGLGGGYASEWGHFGDQQDFFVGLGWKIGPGGLFDLQRQKIADARERGTALQGEQVKAAIGREVVEAALKARSAKDQLAINDEAVTAAEEMAKLAKERQASQLGVVLEYLLAREELTRARQDRVRAVTDYNKAQHELKLAVGK